MGDDISLGICVSHVGEQISLGICVSQVREHISLGICVSQVDKVFHKKEHIDHDYKPINFFFFFYFYNFFDCPFFSVLSNNLQVGKTLKEPVIAPVAGAF